MDATRVFCRWRNAPPAVVRSVPQLNAGKQNDRFRVVRSVQHEEEAMECDVEDNDELNAACSLCLNYGCPATCWNVLQSRSSSIGGVFIQPQAQRDIAVRARRFWHTAFTFDVVYRIPINDF